MSKPDISLQTVDSLSALNLVEKLRDAATDKLKNQGSIRIGPQTYQVTYVRGEGGADKLQMKRNYTGLFGGLLNWWHRDTLTTQPGALALNAKIAELMKSTDYQIVRNTYDRLMDIANAHQGRGVIEVANYGHSEPRNQVAKLDVVSAVNRTLAKSGKSIHLNKIDTYNTELGITTETLMPDQYGATMKKIASGSLEINEGMLDSDRYTVEREDLEQWRAFISDPKIAAKIDIPRKLFAYLNQPEGPSDGDAGLVGWKKDFQMNPDEALRHFVVKNMPASSMRDGADAKTIDFLCDRIKEYVTLYNLPDGPDKDAQMAAFLDFGNWPRTQADDRTLKSLMKDEIKAMAKAKNMPPDETWRRFGKDLRADFIRKHPGTAMKSSASYRLFANVIMYATFRQTSKLGLDFFKSQNKPVLFHSSHRDLKDFGDTGWILNENHWKTGQLDPTYGGSEITHSEVRHANKLVERYGDGTDGANLWFVKGVQ